VCSLSSTFLSKFEGLPSSEKIDFVFGFFAFFPLIFSFFSISNWSRFPSFIFKTQSLLSFFPFYSKYSIDFLYFLFSFFLYDFLCNFFSKSFLLVCSRTTFYKLNQAKNGKTMVVLPRVCWRRFLFILSFNLHRNMLFGFFCHLMSFNLSREGSHEV